MSPGDTAPPGVLTTTQRLASWFDLESAAVVTILLGLFQVMLSVPLVHAGPIDMPRFFILPLLIGILIVAGGSLALANERTPNRYLVVTILLGLFQVMLSVPLVHAGPIDMPRFFILPLLIGILIVAGGSLALANERTPNRYLLQGSACSNVLSLLGAVIAFCLYCFSISRIPEVEEDCQFSFRTEACALDFLMKHCSSILVLLLIYDVGAIVLHCILSTASLRELKNR